MSQSPSFSKRTEPRSRSQRTTTERSRETPTLSRVSSPQRDSTFSRISSPQRPSSPSFECYSEISSTQWTDLFTLIERSSSEDEKEVEMEAQKPELDYRMWKREIPLDPKGYLLIRQFEGTDGWRMIIAYNTQEPRVNEQDLIHLKPTSLVMENVFLWRVRDPSSIVKSLQSLLPSELSHKQTRERICKCGQVMVQRIVKKEGPNKGRRFLTCPQWGDQNCRSFEWI